MTVIPLITGTLVTVPENLEKRVEKFGNVGKNQVHSNRPKYSEESWRPEETCCHLDSKESPPANTDINIKMAKTK